MRCSVCQVEHPRGERWQHLKREHPAYWRGFIVRFASPWAFVALMFGLAAARAPGWTFVGVLIGFLGLSMWARYRSRVERAQRGLGITGGQWLRGAGIGLILMSVTFTIIALVLSLTR